MARALRILLWLVAGLAVLFTAVAGGVVVGLNSGAGRALAVREINRLAGGQVRVAGLGGHFPDDVKLADVQIADADGVWLHGTDLELRWQPLQLLHRDVVVQVLGAGRIDVLRQPVASSGKGGGGGASLPELHLAVDRLEIGTLTLAPAVTGSAIALHVQGAVRFADVAHGSFQLDASSPDGGAQYHGAAVLDPANVELKLHVAEPAGGLLGHYAVPKLQGPLTADVTLHGPRDDAALDFAVALGAARLNGTGHLGLVAPKQFADVELSIPALAPFAAMAGQSLRGSTQLHLRVVQAPGGAVALGLDASVAWTQAPAQLQKFLGASDEVALRASLLNGTATIEKLRLSGADFAVDLNGKANAQEIDLNDDITIDQVAALSPDISGNVTETGRISGALHDFALQAKLGGTITAKGQASAPFQLAAQIEHLPNAPSGTLTGSGMLENAPLTLDAAFAREVSGAAQVKINQARWRSVTAQADLRLAPGALLPTGDASVSIKRLQDFSAFVPVHVQGAVNGDFTHVGGQDVKLNLTASNVVVAPSLVAINGTVTASGPMQALGVKAAFTVAKLMGEPAQAAFAGVLDIKARAAQLASLHASWRGLNATLQGPASIETQPAMAIRHLRIAFNQGSVALDGVIAPQLNATASLRDIPVSMAKLFAPGLQAAGTINADAMLKGPPTAPDGTLKIQATGLHLGQGAAAALPPADIVGNAQLKGTSANMDVKLNAGPQIAFELSGLAPFQLSGGMSLHALGRVDLQLLNLFLAAGGTAVRGELKTDLMLTGTPQNPSAMGNVVLSSGSVENIGTGLNLTAIGADIRAEGRSLMLQDLSATAGQGKLTGQGTVRLDGDMPIDITLNAIAASPVTSDLLTETLNGAVALKGALRGALTLAGDINIAKANINIPHGLPPSVANLPIINAGETPPPPPAPPPAVALDLDVRAKNQIFVRGDGLFAELGGHVHLGGTLAAMDPEGHFDMIRGSFDLAGKTLQFTSGSITFAGDGFLPVLDLVASASSATVSDASLTVGGTAAKPVITLSSTPPLPSDEVLAQLLFGESASSLTPFQAASLAAALAQISGVGSGINPLDKVRNALGLDELSVGGTGSGPPTLQAGRYVAPGVYVGAAQSASGQGTQVNVEINLYKGLKLTTSTGTSSGEASDSVGLSYQFNY